MAARSILDHFNVTSCYHFVNDILNSNLSCFWGLSLFLSILISYCVKTFFFKQDNTFLFHLWSAQSTNFYLHELQIWKTLFFMSPPPHCSFWVFMKEPCQEKAYIDNAACLFKLCLSPLKSTPVWMCWFGKPFPGVWMTPKQSTS